MHCFAGGSEVKNPPANAGSVPESGRSPGEGNGNWLQFSHLENAMDQRAWRATVHGVAKSYLLFEHVQFALIHSTLASSALVVPMQYYSLQYWTLLSPPDTAEQCFCFSPGSSVFLELFLHYSPVAYWTPTNLGGSSSSVISFCLFILFMGFSRKEYWSGGPWASHCPSLDFTFLSVKS